MTDRDDIDMRAWARRAFAAEPAPGNVGDTIGDDLARGHSGLTRRRRWTAGVSGIAVAAVAFAVAAVPSALPDSDSQPQPAGPIDQQRTTRDQQPREPENTTKGPKRAGDGYPSYEQRRLLFEVARDHLDPEHEHLSMHANVQSGGTGVSSYLGTKLNWKVAGESGLGMVEVAIASPGMGDRELRFEVGCDVTGQCERRELPDGGFAWVNEYEDQLMVGYRQADGESVWVVVNPLFGNNSTTPVSSIDVTVDELIDFVADDRLRYLG